MPTITALVTLTPDDDPFGNPTETRISTRSGDVAVELGDSFSLRFTDLAHLDRWVTGLRHDVDAAMAREAAGPALLGGDAA